jgi:ketosteroid isomerase-like protein
MRKSFSNESKNRSSNLLPLSAILFPLLFVTACTNVNQSLSYSEMKTIVEKQNNTLANCFIDRDPERLAQMYTDSAKLSPNGSEFVNGREKIRAFWADDFKTSRVLKMETKVLTLDGNRDVIYETGKAFSDIIYQDSLYHAHVKYINVWRRQTDGSYKLDVDFWNKDGH